MSRYITFDEFLSKLIYEEKKIDFHKEMHEQTSIFCFQVKRYEPLFFRKIIDHITRIFFDNRSIVLLNENELRADSYRLQQMGLHGQTLFFLKETVFSHENSAEFHSFLERYDGPHKFFLFTHASFVSSNKKMLIVNTDNVLTQASFQALSILEGVSYSLDKIEMLLATIQKKQPFSFDFSYVVFLYYGLISQKSMKTDLIYVENLLHGQLSDSLLLLIDLFFDKKKRAFFLLWLDMHDHYTPIFWVNFWSDILWRTYNLIVFMEQDSFRDAKRMSYRLPASFFAHKWKKIDKKALIHGYVMLYEIDFLFKKGSGSLALDTFFDYYFF